MKKEILSRIKELGGNIKTIKNKSLQEDLEGVSFETVLYPKPNNNILLGGNEEEAIYGIENFVSNNYELFKKNKSEFYEKLIKNYYKKTDENYGQVHFDNKIFTPFKKGTEDYIEWGGMWVEETFQKVIKGKKMELMFIGYFYGSPDHLFICLDDLNQENPTVYGTDHEEFFGEIRELGTLEEYFNCFMTKDELIKILKNRIIL